MTCPAQSFCGILTLQVGAAVLAVIFFTLVGLILAVNSFDYYNDLDSLPANLIVVVIFLILMVAMGIIMFVAAYNERKKCAMVAIALGVVIFLLWLVLSGLSLANDANTLRHLCVQERCPESIWLVDLKYRGKWRNICEKNKSAENSKKVSCDGSGNCASVAPDHHGGGSPDVSTTSGPKWPFAEWEQMIMAVQNATLPPNQNLSYHLPLASNENFETKYEMGLPLIGAIILFILNLIFFVFTIFTMWSYYNELKNFVPVKESLS